MSDWLSNIIVGLLTISTGYIYVKLQLFSAEKAFIEFQLQTPSGKQFIRNIGTNTAVNVKVYKIFLDIKSKTGLYKKGTISLKYPLGTMVASEKIEIKLVPNSQMYELFIIEYQNIAGETYQSILKPSNGKGEHEVLYVPKKIWRNKNKLEGIFFDETRKLPRYIRKIYIGK